MRCSAYVQNIDFSSHSVLWKANEPGWSDDEGQLKGLVIFVFRQRIKSHPSYPRLIITKFNEILFQRG